MNLMDPSEDDISIVDIAHSLSRLARFNGHTRHFYSVAQHSVLLAEIVQPHLRLEALLHDASEAYLGDVARPLKALLPEYVRLEDLMARTIASAFGTEYPFHPDIHAADRFMLAWERRDLMNEQEAIWKATTGVDLTNVPKLVVWTRSEAHNKFLAMFDNLYMPACEREAA